MDPSYGRSRRAPATLALALAAALLALAAPACGIPADDRATPIGNADLGPELVETTSTSTTTTSTTTTTLPPETLPGEETTTSTTTTTTLAPATSDVTVYYLIGTSELLSPVRQPQLGAVSPAVIAQLLSEPTAPLSSSNLRTAVRQRLLVPEQFSFDEQTATLTVALDGTVFDSISEEQRRRAIAQVVLTFTSNPFPGRGNVGAVRFAIDGEGIAIVLPATSTATAEGEPVTFADFAVLLDSTVTGTPPPATTPTTPAPGTSLPV